MISTPKPLLIAWVDCGSSTTLPAAFDLARSTQSTLGVRARDAAYNYSPGSFVQIIHDDVAPMPPNVTGLQTTRDSLTIAWDASPERGWRFFEGVLERDLNLALEYQRIAD